MYYGGFFCFQNDNYVQGVKGLGDVILWQSFQDCVCKSFRCIARKRERKRENENGVASVKARGSSRSSGASSFLD